MKKLLVFVLFLGVSTHISLGDSSTYYSDGSSSFTIDY